MLYSVGEKQKATYKAFDDQLVQQNVDTDFANLEPAGKDQFVLVKMPKSAKLEVFHYRGFDFVKLVDVPYVYKYRYVHKMAVIRVFGFTYVALGAKTKDQKEPIIVTIKD